MAFFCLAGLFSHHTPMFRYEAIVTQIRQGIRSAPAQVETPKEATAVAKMRNHRITIVITPPLIDFIPKKTIDQRAFNVSWTQNRVKATLAAPLPNPFCQIRKTDTHIRIQSVLQTGPNARLGGVLGGFFSVAYHVGIALKVKILPIPPAAKLARMLIISLMTSFKSIVWVFVLTFFIHEQSQQITITTTLGIITSVTTQKGTVRPWPTLRDVDAVHGLIHFCNAFADTSNCCSTKISPFFSKKSSGTVPQDPVQVIRLPNFTSDCCITSFLLLQK